MRLPQGSIYLNDYARVVNSDYEAVNGVLHFIDRVLLPPDVLHWEAGTVRVPRVWLGKNPGAGWWAGIPSSLLTMWFMHALSQRNVTTAAKNFGYKMFSRLLTVLSSWAWSASVCDVYVCTCVQCVCVHMCAMCVNGGECVCAIECRLTSFWERMCLCEGPCTTSRPPNVGTH